MSTMFKRTFLLTDADKRKLAEICGQTLLMCLEAQHMGYMVEKLNLPPHAIESNIDEMLYTLKKHIGWKRYLKILFMK